MAIKSFPAPELAGFGSFPVTENLRFTGSDEDGAIVGYWQSPAGIVLVTKMPGYCELAAVAGGKKHLHVWSGALGYEQICDAARAMLAEIAG